MNKRFGSLLQELVEAISSGATTYNGLTLAYGKWEYRWDAHTDTNRLILNCETPRSNEISRIAISNLVSIDASQNEEHHTVYIIACNQRSKHKRKHTFCIEQTHV